MQFRRAAAPPPAHAGIGWRSAAPRRGACPAARSPGRRRCRAADPGRGPSDNRYDATTTRAPRPRAAATASATLGSPVAANASSTRDPTIADSQVAVVCRSRIARRVRRSRRGQNHGISGPPTRFDQTIDEYPDQLWVGAQRPGDRDVAVPAGLDVCGDVAADVVAAGQERGHQHRRPVAGSRRAPHRGSDRGRRRMPRAPADPVRRTPVRRGRRSRDTPRCLRVPCATSRKLMTRALRRRATGSRV